MAITGSSWDLVNYVGELFSADPTRTPIVTLAGDINGAKTVQNDEFPLSVEYSLASAGQNVRSENDAVTAPSAVDVSTSQNKNVIQIQQHSVQVTYKTLSNQNRITGLADTGQPMAVNDWLEFQKARKLETIKRDMEYTWINGSYTASSAETAEQSSRGIFEAISDESNGVAAGGTDLSKDLINQMLREAYDDGAIFSNPYIMVNAFQKQQISSVYEYVPMSRTLGGSDIQAIETDFGRIGVLLNPHMDTNDLLLIDMSVCGNVFQPVPDKGPLFYEPLAKDGAAEKGQLYTQFGCDYGPAWVHNAITGLSTS